LWAISSRLSITYGRPVKRAAGAPHGEEGGTEGKGQQDLLEEEGSSEREESGRPGGRGADRPQDGPKERRGEEEPPKA